jgi:hypothetical protein
MPLLKFQDAGLLGIATFWSHVFMIGISIGCTVLAIYWMTLSSSGFWLTALNNSLLVTNCFLMILSLVSAVFFVLYALDVTFGPDDLQREIAIGSALASQIALCVLLSLSTHSTAEVTYKDLTDYCIRFDFREDVKQFLSEHQTDYAVRTYVDRRTQDLYASTAAVVGLWFPGTLLFVVGTWRLDPPGPTQRRPPNLPRLQRPQTPPGSPRASSPGQGQADERSPILERPPDEFPDPPPRASTPKRRSSDDDNPASVFEVAG